LFFLLLLLLLVVVVVKFLEEVELVMHGDGFMPLFPSEKM
jgi:hypothetical protein